MKKLEICKARVRSSRMVGAVMLEVATMVLSACGGLSASDKPAEPGGVGASLDWANGKYTQAYFGGTPTQSAASGLSAYSAAAGIKSYGVNATWMHTFTPAWFSTEGAQAKRLAGDAANSPITEQRNVIGASAAIGYRF